MVVLRKVCSADKVELNIFSKFWCCAQALYRASFFLTWNEFSINHLNYSKYRNCRNARWSMELQVLLIFYRFGTKYLQGLQGLQKIREFTDVTMKTDSRSTTPSYSESCCLDDVTVIVQGTMQQRVPGCQCYHILPWISNQPLPSPLLVMGRGKPGVNSGWPWPLLLGMLRFIWCFLWYFSVTSVHSSSLLLAQDRVHLWLRYQSPMVTWHSILITFFTILHPFHHFINFHHFIISTPIFGI